MEHRRLNSRKNRSEKQIYRSKTKSGKFVKGFEINYKIFENHVTVIPHTDLLIFNLDTNITFSYTKIILTSKAGATTTVKQSSRAYCIFLWLEKVKNTYIDTITIS